LSRCHHSRIESALKRLKSPPTRGVDTPILTWRFMWFVSPISRTLTGPACCPPPPPVPLNDQRISPVFLLPVCSPRCSPWQEAVTRKRGPPQGGKQPEMALFCKLGQAVPLGGSTKPPRLFPINDGAFPSVREMSPPWFQSLFPPRRLGVGILKGTFWPPFGPSLPRSRSPAESIFRVPPPPPPPPV